MAVRNNAVLGYMVCVTCKGRCSVHQCERGKGRFLYTRGCACGTDQRTGAPVQTAIWNGTEWLPGLKPEREPPNLLKSEKEPEKPGSEPKPEPAPEPKPEPAPEPEDEPDFEPAPDDDAGGDWKPLAAVVGVFVGLLALATGRA